MDEKESQIIVVINTLLEAASDKDESVRDAVNTSLRKIAKKYPNEVLKNAALFRRRNNKLSMIHLAMILKTMKQICEEHLADIDEKVVCELVDFSVEEMTRNKDYLPAAQLPASNILVALGQGHCNKVMEGLLRIFEPGVIPHYAVMHTMGSLASANIFGIVPFVKATLGTMLPMMGMLKQDSYKQVFAFTLGRFSDAVCEYILNIDYAPDHTVRKEAFNAEISIAYDILTNSWVNVKDPKVTEEVLLAIAPMYSLLPPDKMLDQSSRLLSLLFSLYKRNLDPYPITQCLGSVLNSISIRNKASLEPQLDALLNIMFDMVCTSPDYAQPHTVKTHYEVLRCFETIALSFCDRLVELCIQQTRNNNERERVKALHVITHLINSSEQIIRARIGDLLAALKTMLNDSSIKVKRAILKAIVAFACKGHLVGQGARPFIEFIVKNSCTQTPTNSRDQDWASLADEFRESCSSTLYLLSSTVPALESTLWPLLLQLYINVAYTECSATVARCLAQLSAAGQPKKDANDKICDLPSGPEVLARSLCLLGAPFGGQRGLFILKFLEHHIPHVSRHLRPVWEKKLSLLTSLLESKDGWDETAWEELVFSFVENTITEMDACQWTEVLGERLVVQANQYTELPVEHAMALKCLAVVASRSEERLVRLALEASLQDSRHHSLNDSKASARAIGLLSRRHASLVLDRLRLHSKEELNRRPSRLLGLMKDSRQEEGTTRTRITLLLCYAEVALEAPVMEFLPHVDSDLAPWLLEQLAAAKDAATRLSALQALSNLAGALHPNRNVTQIRLTRRGELVASVLSQLGSGLDAGPLILDTATAFLKLPPELPSDECHVVLATCFERTFQLIDIHAPAEEMSPEGFHWTRKLRNLLNSLASLVSELLTQRLGPAVLDDIWIVLESWLPKSDSQHIRLAAVQLLRAALQCYLDNIKFSLEGPSSFTHSGLLVGRAAARCADVWPPVRPAALDCVGLTLQLAARYEGKSLLAAADNDTSTLLLGLRTRLINPEDLNAALQDLATLVGQQLPHYQLIHLAESLLDAMDGQTTSSVGAAQVLRVLIVNKGGELFHHTSSLLDCIISKLQTLTCPNTREATLQVVLALAKHHPKTIITNLLSRPLPFENSVVECWQILVQDSDLAANCLESLIKLLQTGPLCETNSATGLRKATPGPFAAICASQSLFKIALMHEIALTKFSEVFATLYLSLGSYTLELKPKELGPKISPSLNPSREALHTFQRFLLCVNCEKIAEAMLPFSCLDSADPTAHFLEYVPSLVKTLCSVMPQQLAQVITCLNQYASSPQESRRVAITAFYAELVSCKGNGELVLLDGVVCTLLASLNDPCGLVRQLSLEGLAATSNWEPEQMSRYCEQIISALVQGLDDHEASVAIPLVAMRGFSRLFNTIESSQVANLRMTIALRIKPFFGKEDAAARVASLRVLGDLARAGGDTGGDFFEQTQSSLACLLLHLNDNDPEVVLACKYALRQVANLLRDAPRMKNLLLEHLIDDAVLFYPEFISDLCKLIADEMPDLVPGLILHSLTFLKSHWPTVRADAAMLVGVLNSHLTHSKDNNRVSVESVCPKLFLLLRDEDNLVRTRAAHALSALFVS